MSEYDELEEIFARYDRPDLRVSDVYTFTAEVFATVPHDVAIAMRHLPYPGLTETTCRAWLRRAWAKLLDRIPEEARRRAFIEVPELFFGEVLPNEADLHIMLSLFRAEYLRGEGL